MGTITLLVMAPEVTNTEKLLQASDVYSFGVLLLKMLSGKLALYTSDDGEAIQFVKWIQYINNVNWKATYSI